MASSLRLSPITTAVCRPIALLRSRPSISLPSLRHRRGHRRGGAVMLDTAAASYANALADIARVKNALESTMCDVEKLSRVFSPQIQSFFANPTIPAERKAEVACEIAASLELERHTANFLSVVVDMNRADIFQDIVKEFEQCYNKINGTDVAVVSSVVKLDSQQLAQIAQAVQRLTGAKNVRIKTVIDPSLVAGFTIRYGSSGSKLIDLSVKKQLDEIASQLDFSSISFA